MSAVFYVMGMKKENHVLDIYKAIACFFVVAAHCRFPGSFGEFMFCLGAYAVALFFAVAGRYLLPRELCTGRSGYHDDTDVSSRIKSICFKKAAKTLKLSLIITLIYTLYSLVYNLLSGTTLRDWAAEKYTIKELILFLVFNSGKFIYDGATDIDHLWFVFAMVYVFVIAGVLGRRIIKLSLPVTLILLIMLYTGQLIKLIHPVKFMGLNISDWYILRNWLFLGLPFVLLGVWFSVNRDRLLSLFTDAKKAGLIIFLTGILTTAVEYLIAGELNAYFGSLIMVIGSLIHAEASLTDAADERYNKGLTGLLSYIGKNLSAGIYYWHIMVLSLVTAAVFYVFRFLWGNIIYEWTRPVIVLVLTCMFTQLIRYSRRLLTSPRRT